MTVKIGTARVAAETKRWVRQYRFIAELHTIEQQDRLDAAHTAALNMSDVELLSTDPTAMSQNGTVSYPVQALKVIRKSYEFMSLLGDKVDLLSPNMQYFFAAAKACLVYGADSAAADAEIARIVANETPAA